MAQNVYRGADVLSDYKYLKVSVLEREMKWLIKYEGCS